MNIVDHGKWVAYTPAPTAELPTWVPRFALFAKRESDGIDWYNYLDSDVRPPASSVVFTALWNELHSSYTVSAAVYDSTLLFPAGQIVQEITDYGGSDPQADLGGKLYDPVTGAFTDPPQPPWPSPSKSVEERLKALEAKLGSA